MPTKKNESFAELRDWLKQQKNMGALLCMLDYLLVTYEIGRLGGRNAKVLIVPAHLARPFTYCYFSWFYFAISCLFNINCTLDMNRVNKSTYKRENAKQHERF